MKNISDLGLFPKIDGAFTNPEDGEVYFLQGTFCWKLDKHTLKVVGPENIGEKWFGCKQKNNQVGNEDATNEKQTPKSNVVRSFGPPTSKKRGASKSPRKSADPSGRSSRIYIDLVLLVICLISAKCFLLLTSGTIQ